MTPTDIITTKSGLTVQVWQGDCLESLRAMPDESVHCCVTSPPYWGLRSYMPDYVRLRPDTPQWVRDELKRRGILPVSLTSE